MARELAGVAAVAQVNVDESPHLARQFGISGVPALLLFRGGREIDRMSGARPREAVTGWVRRNVQ